MRLLEAIVSANHAAVEGGGGEATFTCYEACLPLAALTCIDPRLNRLFPEMLGLRDEQFIWLRNAGNVITSPTSSTVRSMAIAVFLKGAKEIAVIGHTDCRMVTLGMTDLLNRLKKSGIDRSTLAMPDLHEFFGLFSSEKPNVIKAVSHLRTSPIIPRAIPVHGLLIDSATGRLEWVINGYEPASLPLQAGASAAELLSEKLPPSLPGYISGPLKSLAENLEPLAAKKWDQVTAKVAENVSAAAASKSTPKIKAQKKDPGPFR